MLRKEIWRPEPQLGSLDLQKLRGAVTVAMTPRQTAESVAWTAAIPSPNVEQTLFTMRDEQARVFERCYFLALIVAGTG